ncbi:MAG TPA: YIP1 family protein [Candidatus Saccharimonadales bacterium]|nr:YIP1 family protein [Candidatus Saccharimonadales bacterium]
MNLQTVGFYLKGIVLKPTATFEAISKDTELKSYFVVVIFADIFLAIIKFLLYKPVTSIPGVEAIGPFLGYVDTFSRISSLIPLGIVTGLVTFYVSRMFSKNGTLVSFVTVLGLLSVIESFLSLIAVFFSPFEIVSSILGLWLGYLGFLAIAVLASVSKTKAVVISLVYSGIYVVVFGAIIALYFIFK